MRYWVGFGVLFVLAWAALFGYLRYNTTWYWYWTYLASLNVATCAMYALDKFLAMTKSKSRAPEGLLQLMALGGGFLGAGIGMLVFNHKTSKAHSGFRLAVIVGGLIQAALIAYLFF